MRLGLTAHGCGRQRVVTAAQSQQDEGLFVQRGDPVKLQQQRLVDQTQGLCGPVAVAMRP